MRVALVHDWLTGMRGGEYVLESIAGLFKDPTLFTLVHVPGSVSPALEALRPRTSFLQRLPGIEKRYRHLLPLMPRAAESLDLSGFELVVSSSHCVAKGVRKAPGAVHVSYVHAPMRYMWDRFEDYFGRGRAKPHVRLAARALRGRLQRWDRASSSADRIDRVVANSSFIAGQIESAWGRKASVVHPFADLSRFGAPRAPEAFYLMVGAFAPNKRVDLAIAAFNQLGLPLKIVGGGQDERALRRQAGPTVEFLGQLSNERISELYSRCRAFVFPGLEDFGITPLEAMAAGAPVIAYGAGGVLETVEPTTGVFFSPQTVDALSAAIRKIESGLVAPEESRCRARAAYFTRERFEAEMREEITAAWAAAGKDPALLRAALVPARV